MVSSSGLVLPWFLEDLPKSSEDALLKKVGPRQGKEKVERPRSGGGGAEETKQNSGLGLGLGGIRAVPGSGKATSEVPPWSKGVGLGPASGSRRSPPVESVLEEEEGEDEDEEARPMAPLPTPVMPRAAPVAATSRAPASIDDSRPSPTSQPPPPPATSSRPRPPVISVTSLPAFKPGRQEDGGAEESEEPRRQAPPQPSLLPPLKTVLPVERSKPLVGVGSAAGGVTHPFAGALDLSKVAGRMADAEKEKDKEKEKEKKKQASPPHHQDSKSIVTDESDDEPEEGEGSLALALPDKKAAVAPTSIFAAPAVHTSIYLREALQEAQLARFDQKAVDLDTSSVLGEAAKVRQRGDGVVGGAAGGVAGESSPSCSRALVPVGAGGQPRPKAAGLQGSQATR